MRICDVSMPDPDQKTALHCAAEHRHERIVQLLLAKKAKVDCETNFKQTPLLLAAKGGSVEVLHLLLEQNGFNLNARDRDGRTPLSWAAIYGNEAVVRLLLEKDANFESKDNNDRTPLLWAAV